MLTQFHVLLTITKSLHTIYYYCHKLLLTLQIIDTKTYYKKELPDRKLDGVVTYNASVTCQCPDQQTTQQLFKHIY